MKTRDPEAARLENDYLARIRAVLAGRPESEIAEVLQSVREHIEESGASLPGEQVSLSAMAGIIEQLGPPEAYRVEENRTSESSQASSIVEFRGTGVDYVGKPFEFGSCIGDALDLYSQNFLPLLLASVLYNLLSVISLGILAGPLWGGIALMTLRALQRADHKAEFGDLFNKFGRFWPLFGLWFVETVGFFLGMAFCILPGLLLGTVWGLGAFFMVERDQGVFESLTSSFRATTAPGRLLTNFLLFVTMMLLSIAGGSIPYIGILIQLLVEPLTWFIVALAYIRQTRPAATGLETAALVVGV